MLETSFYEKGSMGEVAVRVLVSYQCDLGLNRWLDVIWE